MHIDLIRRFIAETYVPNEDPKNLLNSTPLLDTGILDSISIIRLIDYLENTFQIKIKSSEIVPEYFGTIDLINKFVDEKKKSK